MSTFWRLQQDMPGKKPKFTYIYILFDEIQEFCIFMKKFSLKLYGYSSHKFAKTDMLEIKGYSCGRRLTVSMKNI